MGCHTLLQGIFPTQELNPDLQHCRQILYHLSYLGILTSPKSLAFLFNFKFLNLGPVRSLSLQVSLAVKSPPASAGGARDQGSIPGSGRPHGGGHGSPLQYSCLENPVDRGAWRALVHRVAQRRTRLKPLSTHAQRADLIPIVPYT